jgi:glycosyltransferase involved in cell wall biosynthesis
MKVVMVIQHFYPSIGGAERQALTLSRKLVQKGVGVTVLTQHDGKSANREVLGDVRVVRMGGSPWSFLLAASFWLLRYRRDYDVIHAHIGSSHAVVAALAGRLCGKKTIVKLSGSNIVGEIPTSRQSFSGRLKLRAFGILKPLLVLVSAAQKNDLHGYGLESLPTCEIPNGVDTDKLSPAPAAEKECLRQKLHWSGVVFLFVGRFSADKLRLDIFRNVLAAWARVKNETAPTSFYLVGGGALEPEYRRLIHTAGLEESVHLLPSSENVDELYRAADVFVLPSVTEGLSNALLEAMACGLPVAASRVAGISDLISEDREGRMFDPLSPEEIYDVFSAMVRDASERHRWGAEGVRLASTLSIENTAEKYLALYRG